jgi:hypothetical protein
VIDALTSGAASDAGAAGGGMRIAGDRSNRDALVLARQDGHDDALTRRASATGLVVSPVAGGRFRFAPSLGALLADPGVDRVVDSDRVRDYLRGEPGGEPEATWLRAVRRLPGGRSFVFTGNLAAAGEPAVAPNPACGARDRFTSVEFLAELPEAVRACEQPFAGLADYLRWYGADPGWEPGELLGRWMRARRAQVQGIFRSPGFCSRSFWDGLEVAEAFRRACARPGSSMVPFWRALNAELWLRCFVDRPRAQLLRSITAAESTELGDLPAAAPGTSPHPGCHLVMVGRDHVPYLRIPVRTRNVWPGDRLSDVVEEGLAGCPVSLRTGDVLVVAEKIVAIGQGRVVRPEDVQVRRLARLLARFTLRTPAGISLGMPESFELAIREAGVARILAGAAAAAVTRPLCVRGVFYRFAGWEVAAIDSPDADALPPSDRCIKLAPDDPEGAAHRLADHVSARIGGRVEVAVVDVNDIGAEVLGASPGVDRQLLVSVLRDNPLGQDVQQTPLGIVRAADAGSGR